MRQSVGNLRVVPHAGSIDSLAPAPSPLRGFVHVARSRGSVPAGDMVQWALIRSPRQPHAVATALSRRVAENRDAPTERGDYSSPFRCFVYVAPLPATTETNPVQNFLQG